MLKQCFQNILLQHRWFLNKHYNATTIRLTELKRRSHRSDHLPSKWVTQKSAGIFRD